jgi:hypothetical protein
MRGGVLGATTGPTHHGVTKAPNFVTDPRRRHRHENEVVARRPRRGRRPADEDPASAAAVIGAAKEETMTSEVSKESLEEARR